MIKYIFPNLLNLIVLYLLKLKYLPSYYINLHKDFLGKIKFIYKCFDYKRLKYQPNITRIIIYHNMRKKNYIIYNKKKYITYFVYILLTIRILKS